MVAYCWSHDACRPRHRSHVPTQPVRIVLPAQPDTFVSRRPASALPGLPQRWIHAYSPRCIRAQQALVNTHDRSILRLRGYLRCVRIWCKFGTPERTIICALHMSAFRHYSVAVWNNLRANIHSCTSTCLFSHHLKTFIYPQLHSCLLQCITSISSACPNIVFCRQSCCSLIYQAVRLSYITIRLLEM